MATHEAVYYPYQDVGLVGHYFASLDVTSRYIVDEIAYNAYELTQLILESELYRAKNHMYQCLMKMSDN